MTDILHTALCDLLGARYPILLAGMGGVARSELVAAVTRAGGYGFLGMVREAPDFIEGEIRALRDATALPFGVNLIPAATAPDLLQAEVAVCLAEKVQSVCLFWDVFPDLVRRLKDAGIIVLHQVGSLADAEAALAAGADALIVQGIEAGGHVRGTTPWAALLPEVRALTRKPIAVAGGITDGADLARALRAGADGVWVGTAFLATRESFAHDYHKDRVVQSPGETVHTDVFHRNWPKGAPVRVLPNSVTRGERGDPWAEDAIEIAREGGRPIHLFSTDSPLRNTVGDLEAMALYAGTGAGRVTGILPAGERLRRMADDAARILRGEDAR